MKRTSPNNGLPQFLHPTWHRLTAASLERYIFFNESHYPATHFFDKNMKDHTTLCINAHNTFLKSGMLPSEMWEIISGRIS
jgi:hypothetical protein